MYYVIYCEDNEDSLEKRRTVRPAHLARVEKLQQEGRLIVAGPLMKNDDENILIAGIKGSLIIAEFPDIHAAKAWAAADPYVTADVYARVTVEPFKKILPASQINE